MTWTLYEGDCLEVLASIPDGTVDAVVTDPPYNVGLDYKGYDDNKTEESYIRWCCDWLWELQRVCRGGIAISVGMSNLSMWGRIARPDWWMCWHKPAAMGRCMIGFNNWEPIAVFGKPYRQGCDVVRAAINPDPSLSGHPCPKPLEWANSLVDLFCPPNGIVLDPFMGSGTTGVACVRKGRDFIGIELNPDYFAIAKRRIEEAEAHRNGTAGELFASQSTTPLFDTKGTP